MCSPEVSARLIPILKKLELPTEYTGDLDNALNFVVHDKKCKGGFVEAVFVEKVGEYKIEKISVKDFSSMIKERLSSI